MRQIVIDIRRKKDFVKLIPIVVAIARFDPNERINEAYEVHPRHASGKTIKGGAARSGKT